MKSEKFSAENNFKNTFFLKREMFFKIVLLSFVVVFFIIKSNNTYAENKTNYTIENAWTQLGENSHIFVRAIISGTNVCPNIIFLQNNKETNMSMLIRMNYANEKFPVLVCEQSVPNNTTKIILNNKELPILKQSPKRFLLIGDSGCRLKGKMVQNCNDENAWTFKKIAQEALKTKPDIIIHLGDYHYRETPCPKGNSGCLGATTGENWISWKEDFFSPAKNLLFIAPLVFIRGDHESCGRSGEGWFYFLDSRKNQKECKKYTEPYRISLSTVTLLTFDSSQVLDNEVDPQDLKEYTKELEELNKTKANTNNWFITHKPVWGIGVPRQKGLLEYSNEIKTKELQAVFNKDPFDNTIDLLLAGHIHLFQILSLGKQYPPQIVSGNGGTLLEYYTPKAPSDMKIDNKNIEYIKTIEKFGFTILEIENNNDLKAELYDLDGNIKLTCMISKRTVHCN